MAPVWHAWRAWKGSTGLALLAVVAFAIAIGSATARGPRRPAGGVGGRAYDDLTFVVMKVN